MSASPSIAFDGQIWRRQRRGGISRYFKELRSGLAARGVAVEPGDRRGRRRAQLVHATFYGGRPYRLRSDQALVSSLFDMTPERHPEHLRFGGLRSPHLNKAAWLTASDLIISISAASADDLAFFWPQLRTPVVVVPLATAIDAVAPTPIAALAGRRFWLLVGKRHGYKNGHTLLRALQRLQLQARSGDWPLLVCAGGEPWNRAERLSLASHGLTPWVRQVVAGDGELAWLYRQAEAVLVPSLAEGFSLPLIEALACNTPVLASNLEVHHEVAGGFATLLPALNAAAWAEALAGAAATPLPRPATELGASAWQKLRQFYSLPRLLADHQRTYQQLATEVAKKLG